jgi:hypothetical protein
VSVTGIHLVAFRLVRRRGSTVSGVRCEWALAFRASSERLQVGDSPLGAAARNADVPPPLANRRRNKANSDSLLMAYYIVTFLASSRLHSWQTHSSATATSSVSHALVNRGIASSLVMMDNGGASIKIRTEQYLAGCERGVRQGRTRGPTLGAKTTPPREIDKTRLNREKNNPNATPDECGPKKNPKICSFFFWGGKFWFRALPGPAPVGPNADASSLSNNTPEHSTVLNPGVAFLPDPEYIARSWAKTAYRVPHSTATLSEGVIR